MSTWQGACGFCETTTCAPVLVREEAQLSSGMRAQIMSAATIFNGMNTSGKPLVFKSSADYVAYKKARSLAGAGRSYGRPLPSAAIAGLVCTTT